MEKTPTTTTTTAAAPSPTAAPAYAAPAQPPAAQAPTQPGYDDAVSSPDSYVRDPHRLIAYVLPFPAPSRAGAGVDGGSDAGAPPLRFLIYTPPPPPLLKPAAGEKERLAHKVQRKWQDEVRDAKTSGAKVASWKGIKARVTKGISWAVDKTTTADLDFLTRIPKDGEPMPGASSGAASPAHSDDEADAAPTTGATVKLEEMVLVYPPGIGRSPEQLRAEFVDSLLRTKSKAQKDAVIATGLLPVAACLDWALIFVGWVFGGALEVDGVWMAASYRGAKTARSVTKRLASSSSSGDPHTSSDALKLTFVPSHRADILTAYLAHACAEQDARLFPAPSKRYTEEDVLEAIGWTNSGAYESSNWEDEAWERTQVIDDLKTTIGKGAKGWDKWVRAYEKNPGKALKK
ncbi:hypothetical protein Q5752_003098 [Cryptotrichosporon argae]